MLIVVVETQRYGDLGRIYKEKRYKRRLKGVKFDFHCSLHHHCHCFYSTFDNVNLHLLFSLVFCFIICNLENYQCIRLFLGKKFMIEIFFLEGWKVSLYISTKKKICEKTSYFIVQSQTTTLEKLECIENKNKSEISLNHGDFDSWRSTQNHFSNVLTIKFLL